MLSVRRTIVKLARAHTVMPAPGSERQRAQGRAEWATSGASPFLVMLGKSPLLSGLDGLDRVQGVGRSGLPTHRPGRDADCGAPAPSVLAPRCHPGLVPGSRPAPDRDPGETGRERRLTVWTPEQVRGDKRGAGPVSPIGTEPVPKLNRTAMEQVTGMTMWGAANREVSFRRYAAAPAPGRSQRRPTVPPRGPAIRCPGSRG